MDVQHTELSLLIPDLIIKSVFPRQPKSNNSLKVNIGDKNIWMSISFFRQKMGDIHIRLYQARDCPSLDDASMCQIQYIYDFV